MNLQKEEAILEYKLDLTEEKGVRKGKIEVVKAMLANNNTIVKFTGLSTSEIKELQN
nr:hypothetical protein [Wolbachia endosymbiont of Oedothorax gibbosus]